MVDARPVADLGFPRGGGANSPGGVPTYDFAKISQKLHEIERIWTPRGGGARPKFYYVDPPLKADTKTTAGVIHEIKFEQVVTSN